jgi:hypothetical protein
LQVLQGALPVPLSPEEVMTWPPERDIVAPVSPSEHEAVRTAQRALGLVETGELDEPTKASLRGVQRLFGAQVTGVLDLPTAALLTRLRHIYPED